MKLCLEEQTFKCRDKYQRTPFHSNGIHEEPSFFSLTSSPSSKKPSQNFSLFFRNCKPKVQNAGDWTFSPPNHFKQNKPRSKKCNISYALPETAASVLVAAVAVGAAATILRRTTKAQETVDSPSKVCEDCSGSGICAECNGEGFVLKKLTEESAVKARMAAKNMATRYTAGLPKKWSYCSKCSSARSCSTCGGRGRVSD